MAVFKKRVVDPSQVAAAAAVAATAPIVGDPRMAPVAPPQEANAPAQPATPGVTIAAFGARQDLAAPTMQDGYSIGQVYEVPLGKIKPNPFNPRVHYSSSTVDAMVESLEAEGQQVAATAFVDAQGQVTLIDGEKRLRAARAGGLSTLRVEIRPQPADDRLLYEYARSTNSKRSEQSPLDDAVRWRQMLDAGIYVNQSGLAKALALTEDVVSRTLKLSALPQRILHALTEEPDLLKLRMLSAVREFWEASDDENTLDLIQEITRRGLGYREVEMRRKALEKGPVTKPRASREPVRFGQAKGEIKIFPDGRMELSFKDLSEAQSDRLRLQLVKLLKEEEDAFPPES